LASARAACSAQGRCLSTYPGWAPSRVLCSGRLSQTVARQPVESAGHALRVSRILSHSFARPIPAQVEPKVAPPSPCGAASLRPFSDRSVIDLHYCSGQASCTPPRRPPTRLHPPRHAVSIWSLEYYKGGFLGLLHTEIVQMQYPSGALNDTKGANSWRH
jgi:hypothetical protein